MLYDKIDGCEICYVDANVYLDPKDIEDVREQIKKDMSKEIKITKSLPLLIMNANFSTPVTGIQNYVMYGDKFSPLKDNKDATVLGQYLSIFNSYCEDKGISSKAVVLGNETLPIIKPLEKLLERKPVHGRLLKLEKRWRPI